MYSHRCGAELSVRVRVRQLPLILPPQILDGVSVGAGGWIDEVIRVIDRQMLEPLSA